MVQQNYCFNGCQPWPLGGQNGYLSPWTSSHQYINLAVWNTALSKSQGTNP